MRPHLLLPFLFLAACDRPQVPTAAAAVPTELPAPAPVANPEALLASLVRINSTQQSWDPAEPWKKRNPGKRRALGAIVGEGVVLTTAELTADATFLEFESPDGKRLTPAKVIAVDYEANLALLGPESESGAKLFEGTKPLEIASSPKLGDTLEILQVEQNGSLLSTTGAIQSIDVLANFLPTQFFLTYQVKASMQGSASSFSLPAVRDGKLVGLLTSYNSNDQISDVTATDIVTRFVKESSDGNYAGFPSLGVTVSRTEDPNFRLYLKLTEDGGGLYVSELRPGGAAEKAGLQKGDVILKIDGHEIDRLGYFQDPHYGRLYWSHLVRGAKSSGEEVKLSIQRGDDFQELTAELDRRDETDQLVPAYTFGKAPLYLVKGGLIFQELTRPLLESFGNEWQLRAPLKLLDVFENPQKYESRARRIVFLSNVIPTPATVGYESLQSLVVTKVNGREIKDMKSLVEAFDQAPASGLHSIEFDEEKFSVYLDEALSSAVDGQLLQRGLPRLSRTEE